MTNIKKYSPFTGIDQAWEAFFEHGGYRTPSGRGIGLSYEIKPGEDAVTAEVEVPGCSPEDVKVSCEGRAIHVVTPRGNAYFTVGARIDMDHIEASIRHGLLTLRVPKREARKVQVKVTDNEE